MSTAIEQSTPGAVVAPAAASIAPSGFGRVLVAEDDPDIQALIAMRMRAAGSHVHCVSTGPAALDAVAQEAFNLLLLDVGMPGATGIDVTAHVRRRAEQQPAILLISGFADEHTVGAGLDAGADGYLRKPFSIAELRTHLALVAQTRLSLRPQPQPPVDGSR